MPPTPPKANRKPQTLHLSPEEAELLAVETHPRRKRSDPGEGTYPHDWPGGTLSEEAVVAALTDDDSQEAREDVDETVMDAQDRTGTEEDPGSAALGPLGGA